MENSQSTGGGVKALFSELRRRRVLRSAALYIAIAWVLVQVIATVFPIFDISDAYQRYATIALIAGFPIAVVVSWLFDISPGSITRTSHRPTGQDDNAQREPTTHGDQTVVMTTGARHNIPERSIAVMPFANVGRDPQHEFFSDGIAEELLNLLSKVQDLQVAARTSSFAFKDSQEGVREIALRLGVRHVLEGSVRREASRVRISAQLIDAQTGYQLWSSSYDRELHDIFAVQDEISSAIVYALQEALDETTSGAQAMRATVPTQNMDAYQLYLRGMYLWQRRGTVAITAAIEALTQAVEADPEFVEAISLLAITKAILHEYSGEDRELGFAEAEQLAERVMTLAPNAGKPHAVLGYICMRRWQWSQSERYFQSALKLNPSEALAHQWYSNLLNDVGRQKAALGHALKAYHADRLSPQANNILALNFVMLGRDVEARKHAAVAREFGLGGAVPDWVDYFVYLRHQNYEAAVEVMTRSLQRSKADTAWVRPTVDAMADPGLMGAALEALQTAIESNSINTSMAIMQHILLNQSEPTFELANSQIEDHALIHLWFLLPEAAALREDGRFLSLMERMNLVAYWQTNGWPQVVASLRD